MAVISRALSTRIKELIELATTGGKLVVAVVQIMEELENAGLVYRLTIPPKLVLVHRRNRDGMGVGYIDVHLLCDDLMDIGFDPSKPDPICVEIAPEDKKFNKQLIENADGKLGPADQGTIDMAKFASLSASHCNFCLRLITDEAEHEGSQGLCKDGRLSPAMCQYESPGLYKASKEGLLWRVIRLEAVLEFPDLPDLVQAAKNTDPSRGERDLQILRRVHNLVSAQVFHGKQPDYNVVKKAALRSKPACAAALQLTSITPSPYIGH